ncbi:MAG: hypothetical protein KKB81_03440 [Candidatus Margulisbacteria bacterium]|nr:hypothetical protein [Candidatus Margulisiibacteriota bacterium]MBU1021021.1 hypothetical protein [Candidatus Margulisiibacteriota bacterium]MBU1729261.1 hypothetical protein [Candidatus Margulisiibacteriota bacterium]MBU1955534.1 hypothetical protein [Candidatus Margulisiibacteriota bacterium]
MAKPHIISSHLARSTGYLAPVRRRKLATMPRLASVILVFKNGNMDLYCAKNIFSQFQIISLREVINRLRSRPHTQHLLYGEKINGEFTFKNWNPLEISDASANLSQDTLEQIADSFEVNRITRISADQSVVELFIR